MLGLTQEEKVLMFFSVYLVYLSWVSRAGAAIDCLELSSSGGYSKGDLECELQMQLSVEART